MKLYVANPINQDVYAKDGWTETDKTYRWGSSVVRKAEVDMPIHEAAYGSARAGYYTTREKAKTALIAYLRRIAERESASAAKKFARIKELESE